MRWGWIALLVMLACKRESAPPAKQQTTVAANRDASVADATNSDAGPAMVNLFRAVRTSITVSSRVSNAKIKLEHLVDRDMNTAWNSRTGDLVGAWLDISIPDTAFAKELRLTVGHTGKGPKGEDYFTMNPRISKVRVTYYGKPAGTFDLDVDKRELQTIPLPSLNAPLRIEVLAIKPGSKAKWRETCISELEVWGTPPTGTKLPGTYTPFVQEVVPDSLDKLCDDVKPEAGDDSGLSNCELLPTGFEVDPPWGSPAVLNTVTHRVEHHGHVYSDTIEQTLVFVVSGKAFLGPVLNNTGNSDDGTGSNKEFAATTTITEVLMVQAEKGNPGELAIRYRIDDAAPDADKPSFKDMVIVCATDGRCSDTFPVATQDWEINVRVVDDTIVRKKGSGSPPAKELGTTKLVLR